MTRRPRQAACRAARPTARRAPVLVALAALAVGLVAGAPLAGAQEGAAPTPAVQTVTDAEFRWGLNRQSAGPSHGPGHNYLSAGDISGALPGPHQQVAAADWSVRSGAVRIDKRTAAGTVAPATWEGTRTDQSGTPFASSSTRYSGLEMVFDGGAGTVDPEAGTAEIEWDGTVSVLYYSGLVYVTLSDPVLTVTPSRAVVTATAGGHHSDRENPAVWEKLAPREVVVAELPRGDVDLGGDKGFSVTPRYLGVRYSAKNGDAPQFRTGEEWGSFPAEFVDFASAAGAGSFWYSSGTSDDSKPALPVTVSWNSGDPATMPDSGDSGTTRGLLGRVVEDTVEAVIRSAGEDVADTAAAWMDEAWKPAQPGARTATGGDGTVTTVTGEGRDTATAREGIEDLLPAGARVTAGTVGAALASAPARPAGGSAGAATGPGVSSVPAGSTTFTDQATVPVAAQLPLHGADVVYAQTSTSQEAENPTHQWQWWVGAALLALAAVPFYQTVRRKDHT